ncbi:MAG: hypothetical protein BIFFINMI_02007 [Phycisphaerae bacterium]|nr:hypothetical protein [Phycisphaerae bacterium]MCG3179666.1 hypothetical protein [Phycisphaerae bacterium]
MADTDRMSEILERVPADQRAQAAALLAEYGPALLDLAVADAWAYLRRIQAGDLEAVHELLMGGSDDAFIAAVKANTARWSGVADAELARAKLAQDIALKAAPVVVSILAALVGL